MEILSKVSGHWLEIVTAVYLIGMILYGHYKGFIRLAVSAAALVITLIAVNYAQTPTIEWLKKDTPVYETLKTKITENIGMEEIAGGLGFDKLTEKADEWTIIENLPLPEQMKKLLAENNNPEIYEMMGVNAFVDYIGGYVADTVLTAAVFVILFIVISLVLHIAMLWLDLIAKLPILSGVNKVTGAVLGGVEAMVIIWVICIILTMFSGTELGKSVLAQIDASIWLSWIYDHNILSYLILGVIRSVW